MNQSSSITTGTTTVAAAGLTTLLNWVLNIKCNWGAPLDVVAVMSAGIMFAGHLATNLVNARIAARQPAPPVP